MRLDRARARRKLGPHQRRALRTHSAHIERYAAVDRGSLEPRRHEHRLHHRPNVPSVRLYSSPVVVSHRGVELQVHARLNERVHLQRGEPDGLPRSFRLRAPALVAYLDGARKLLRLPRRAQTHDIAEYRRERLLVHGSHSDRQQKKKRRAPFFLFFLGGPRFRSGIKKKKEAVGVVCLLGLKKKKKKKKKQNKNYMPQWAPNRRPIGRVYFFWYLFFAFVIASPQPDARASARLFSLGHSV